MVAAAETEGLARAIDDILTTLEQRARAKSCILGIDRSAGVEDDEEDEEEEEVEENEKPTAADAMSDLEATDKDGADKDVDMTSASSRCSIYLSEYICIFL